MIDITNDHMPALLNLDRHVCCILPFLSYYTFDTELRLIKPVSAS